MAIEPRQRITVKRDFESAIHRIDQPFASSRILDRSLTTVATPIRPRSRPMTGVDHAITTKLISMASGFAQATTNRDDLSGQDAADARYGLRSAIRIEPAYFIATSIVAMPTRLRQSIGPCGFQPGPCGFPSQRRHGVHQCVGAYMDMRQFDRAIEGGGLRSGRLVRSRRRISYFNRGNGLMQTGNVGRAIEDYDKANRTSIPISARLPAPRAAKTKKGRTAPDAEAEMKMARDTRYANFSQWHTVTAKMHRHFFSFAVALAVIASAAVNASDTASLGVTSLCCASHQQGDCMTAERYICRY